MKSLKFIIPSILGAMLFFIPFSINDSSAIFISHFVYFIKDNFIIYIYSIVTIFFFFNFLTSLIATYFKRNEFLSTDFTKFFVTNSFGVFLRLLASLFTCIIIYYVQVGAHELYILNIFSSPDTGQVVLSFVINLFLFVLLGNLLLVLLTEFGLLEFFGTLLSKFFLKVFKVPPGFSNTVVGFFLGYTREGFRTVEKQYQSGNISQRVTYKILFSFLILELPLIIYILNSLELTNYFIQFYLSIFIINGLAAAIIVRLPIATKYSNKSSSSQSDFDCEYSLAELNQKVIDKCNDSFDKLYIIRRRVVVQIINSSVTLLPFIMVFGTISIVLINYPIYLFWGDYYLFDTLSIPISSLLEYFSIPDSVLASKAIIYGILDFSIPSIIIYSSPYEKTRFFIGLISILQIVYITKYYLLFKKSNFNYTPGDFISFYIIRMAIILPLCILTVNFIF